MILINYWHNRKKKTNKKTNALNNTPQLNNSSEKIKP